MAKGDHDRAERAINTQGSQMQNTQDNTRWGLEQTKGAMQNNYTMGSGANLTTYDDVMGRYKGLYDNPFGTDPNLVGGGLGAGGGGGYQSSTQGIYSDLANNGGGYGWDPMFRGAMGDAIGGYGDFARTGGFSDQNIQDIRARSVAPMRAVYSNAQNDLDRSRSLTGGGANYAASKAKMSRELGYGLADASTDAEAQIAQMVQQGRLAGLSGLSSTGAAGQGLSTDIDSLNAQMKLAGLSGLDTIDARNAAASAGAGARADANAQDLFKARMGILGGMQDMYGTNPALLNVTGNQLLGADQNLLQGQQLQNQISQGLIGQTMGLQNIPGNFQQAMGNVNSVLGTVGNIAGSVMGGFGGLLPGTTNQMPGTNVTDQLGMYAPRY